METEDFTFREYDGIKYVTFSEGIKNPDKLDFVKNIGYKSIKCLKPLSNKNNCYPIKISSSYLNKRAVDLEIPGPFLSIITSPISVRLCFKNHPMVINAINKMKSYIYLIYH